MTFDDLKRAVKSHHNLTSEEADTRVGQSLNRHYRRVTSSIGMDATRFVTRTTTTTVGVQTVTFSNIEKIDRVIDATDSDAIRLLQEVSIHTQRSSQPGDGQPDTFALQNTDADAVTVLLDTVPQTTYSLQADGWATLADLTSTDAPVFPESFHDILSFAVIAEEYLRKGKLDLAGAYKAQAEDLLSQLRLHLSDSPTELTRQGQQSAPLGGGSSAGGTGTVGGTSYTQTGLITFDRDPAAPFAVASGSAKVTNLDADLLDGQTGTYYLDRTNHTGTDPVTGGGTGLTSVAQGDLLYGSASNTLSALAKNTTATRVLTNTGTSNNPAWAQVTLTSGVTGVLPTANGGTSVDIASAALPLTSGQITFPATQNASSGANTLDDYEEGTWSPTDASGAALTFATVEGVYVKVGQLVFAAARLTFPATADGSAAIIGSFPFTLANTTNNQFVGGVVTDLAANAALRGIKNTTTAAVVTPSTNAAITNATLSGKFLIFNFTYRATA